MSSKNRPDSSLKRALLKRFFWVILLAWTLIGGGIYSVTNHELDELYDGEMAQVAHVLLGIYSDQEFNAAPPRVTSSPFEGGDNYEHKLAFQIWSNQGTLLLRSENAPLEAMASETGKFLTKTIFDNVVRTLAIHSPDGKLIAHVAQNLEIRRENTTEILKLLFYGLILAFPILMWLINRSINHGTQSLNTLSEKIARRTEHDLALIETDDIPQEIQGIVSALNKLMSRVSAALGRERQFISDAAHELRTPLSGIKAHAQLAIKDESRRLNSLTRIVEGVDRTTRLANQLLTLSGVDAMNKLDAVQIIRLNELIHTVVDDLSTGIKEKSLQLVNNAKCSQGLSGNEDLLYILIRNLIDNAIRYTPKNSQITLDCEKTDHGLSFSVMDQGPGIATEHRQRVFDRFYRDIENDSNGSGLGLAIAEKIARLHGAKIELKPGENHQGLIAKVSFKL